MIVRCSNCGAEIKPELGVAATATTVQHRECAERFGVGTRGKSTISQIDNGHPRRATGTVQR